MQQKKQSKYVDRTQWQYETALTSALLIVSFAELNNFIKNRTTAKSRDLTSAFRSEKHSSP